MTLPANNSMCVVEIETRKIQLAAAEMMMGLRRLKRVLRACDECGRGDTCHIVAKFNQQIQIALTQVVTEWGLANNFQKVPTLQVFVLSGDGGDDDGFRLGE